MGNRICGDADVGIYNAGIINAEGLGIEAVSDHDTIKIKTLPGEKSVINAREGVHALHLDGAIAIGHARTLNSGSSGIHAGNTRGKITSSDLILLVPAVVMLIVP